MQEKRERKEKEKEEGEEKKEKSEAQKKPSVDKRKEQFVAYLCRKGKKKVKEKGRKRNRKESRAKQLLGGSGRWLFLPLILIQNWFWCRWCSREAGAKRESGSAGNHYRVGYFWHSEGWTSINRITKHPWLMACDANMSPEDFEKSLWFKKDQMHVIAPERQRADHKNAKGEWLEKVYDYVISCSSSKGRISDMKGIDVESRPYKAVTFVVE